MSDQLDLDHEDEELRLERDEELQKIRAQQALVMDELMGSVERRAFFYEILEQSAMNVDTFNPDPHIHARLAGRRSVGLWLKDEIRRRSPAQYLQMIAENELK